MRRVVHVASAALVPLAEVGRGIACLFELAGNGRRLGIEPVQDEPAVLVGDRVAIDLPAAP